MGRMMISLSNNQPYQTTREHQSYLATHWGVFQSQSHQIYIRKTWPALEICAGPCHRCSCQGYKRKPILRPPVSTCHNTEQNARFLSEASQMDLGL